MALTDITDTPLVSLAPRPADSHKGMYGHALLIGGSRGMSGSITLSGLAALRGGAGLVTIAVPRAIQDLVAGANPCYMTVGLAHTTDQLTEAAADELLSLAAARSVVALGPGLGRAAGVAALVMRLYRELTQPLVVDADALNALAEHPDALSQPAGPRILTPHPGEFARLTGVKPASDDHLRAQAAADLAAASNPSGQTIVVLKGNRTVITDGTRYAINPTGNPGMATGGTGDVLTGLITALLGQHLAPVDAARLGAYLHGQAGDLAAQAVGQVSLIASDLIDYLPAAFQQLNQRATPITGFGRG